MEHSGQLHKVKLQPLRQVQEQGYRVSQKQSLIQSVDLNRNFLSRFLDVNYRSNFFLKGENHMERLRLI